MDQTGLAVAQACPSVASVAAFGALFLSPLTLKCYFHERTFVSFKIEKESTTPQHWIRVILSEFTVEEVELLSAGSNDTVENTTLGVLV